MRPPKRLGSRVIPKVCPKCAETVSGRLLNCPQCGLNFASWAKPKPAGPKTLEELATWFTPPKARR